MNDIFLTQICLEFAKKLTRKEKDGETIVSPPIIRELMSKESLNIIQELFTFTNGF